MSENENQPAPSKQTSSVPLKKETVRVTLKAADAPPAAGPPAPVVAPPTPTAPGAAPVVRPPTATLAGPPPAPTAPTVGGPPRAPAPAPTIPLRASGAPTAPLRPPGAPTAPGAPRPPMGSGAPTIPLRSPGAPTTPGSVPAPGPTIALPKATVQLQAPTQPLGTARPALTQAPTLQSQDEEDEGSGETVANVLSIVGFIAALAVLAFQLMITNTSLKATYMPVEGEIKGTPPNYTPPPAPPAERSLFGDIFQSEQ